MDLQDIRDLIIIIAGSLMALVLIVALIVTIVLGVAIGGLVGMLKSAVKGQLTPALDSARQVVDDIRGTTSFIADTTVSPIIRFYGLINGIRRGISALAGFGRKHK